MRWILALSLLLTFACGDDDNPREDAGSDTATDMPSDSGPAETIEDLRIESEISIAGLGAAVDAVQDDRGMWHIYGGDIDDVIRAQGYLQARDRMGQMEFIRRQATGSLAEFAGSFVPELFDIDAEARFDGHRRNAMEIEPTLSDEDRAALEAYMSGVNTFIARLRTLEEQLPRGVNTIVNGDALVDWTVIDSLSIARLQAASLSLDATSDIARTDQLSRWKEHFPDDASDPRISRLALAFHDLFMWRPAHEVSNIDGFPNIGTDSGTRAFVPELHEHTFARLPALPRRALQGALEFAERREARFSALFGDGFRGSNSWIVSGDNTANGNPILSNDPHLGLTSPPLFWMAHVNTKRAGGDIDAAGQMIAGTPVNILGFTDRIACGLTTTGYDVSDAYVELITPGDPDTVEFEGGQVALEDVEEVVRDDVGGSRTFVFQRVPHHGMIIPDSRVSCEVGDAPPCEVGKDIAISIKWTGNTPSNEAGAFFDLYRADNVDEARDAFAKFEVGGQTLSVVDHEGNLFYTSSLRIPVREAATNTYDPVALEGVSPCFALDGRGGQEWTTELVDDRYIPHALNPASGFLATANADPVGATFDGDPHNGVDPADPEDDIYLTCDYAGGHRLARITERLTEMVAAGGITQEQMSALHNDALSPYGRVVSPMIVEQLDRALEEEETPGTHTDLMAAVAEHASVMDRVQSVRDRLNGWAFDTPAAVEGTPGAPEIGESTAASIFNVTFGHLMRLTFDDEFDWHANGAIDGTPARSSLAGRTMIWMVRDANTLVSYDSGLGDSVLWDDIGTDAVESRGERVLQAVVAAVAWLDDRFETEEMDMWRWGNLHTLQLDALVPASLLGEDVLSIPTPSDAMFPNGFPRHGDRGVIDASNFGVFDFESIDYGSGPQQRLVVEMTPEGPRAWNALPGGNSEDPDSPFHRNEMERWRNNEVSPVAFTEEDVVAAAVRRIRFVP